MYKVKRHSDMQMYALKKVSLLQQLFDSPIPFLTHSDVNEFR